MFPQIKAFWALFQQGKQVGNPATWKQRQIGVNAVHGLLWAAITAWVAFSGQDLQISEETVNALSLALVTAVPALIELFTIITTVITSVKVGLSVQSSSDSP